MTRGNIIRSFIGLGIVLVLAIGGVARSKSVTNPATGGATMGTSYSVKIAERVHESTLSEIAARVDQTLERVNRQMSTWDPESEISRFNHSDSTNAFECSREFAAVTRRALALSADTRGAFDPTLQPLLNLWGFGSESEEHRVPSDEEIAAAQRISGWKKMSVGETWIQKSAPELSLELSAIAKGYGVDALAEVMREAGLENWFVEIGGEVVVHGENPDGNPWRLGVQSPNPMAEEVIGIVHLTSGAMATSGSYLNFFRDDDDQVLAHILDPRSGRAITSDLVSVTVVAPTCAEADGVATALFVMGADEGARWVNERPGVEALFLRRDGPDDFTEIFSSGFEAATSYISNL